MAIDKVTAGVLADNAVTTTKVADNAVTGAKIADDTTLPGSFVKLPSITTTQRNALSASVGMMIYNSTTGLAETYTALGWKSVDAPPTIASISPTTQAGTTADVVVTGTRFVTGFVAKFIGNDGTTFAPASTVFTNATTVTLRTPSTGLPASKEPFDIQITNPNGMTAVLHDVLDVGGEPTWTTASGSLGTLCDAARKFPQDLTAMAATDPQSRTITYSIQDGALPAGLSINSGTAALTGTAAETSSDTTYNFTVRASTPDGDFTDRAFSIAIAAKRTTYFTATGADQDWTAPAGVTRVTVSAWGASGGNENASGWGGAGAYVKGTVKITAGAAYKIVVGRGGRRGGSDTEEVGTYGGGGNGQENPSGGGLSGFFDGNGAVFSSSASGTAYEANAQPVAAAWISGTDSRPNASWDRNRIIAGGGGGADPEDPGGNGGGGAVGGSTTSLAGGCGNRSNEATSGGVGGAADGTLRSGQNAGIQGGGHLKGADGQKAYANIAGNPRWLGGGGGGYMGGMAHNTGPDGGGGGGSSYTHPTLVTDVTTEGANSAAAGTTRGSSSGSSGLVYGASDIDRYNRIGGDIATNYTAGQVTTTSTGAHGIHGRLVLNY